MLATTDLVKETITVTQVGKFGPKVGNVWYSVNEPLTPTDFQAGHSYDVLVRISKPSLKNPAGGKKYIHQIIGDATPVAVSPAPLATTKATPKNEHKPRDFDAEARGKTRCVQFEAALMSPALAGLQFNGIDEYIELVKKAADAGVAYTFEDK